MTNQHPGGGAGQERPGAQVNARLQKASTGLQKAVTGREDVIRAQAARAAKRLDAKTEGRHHEKLRVALHVLDFVIDRFGEPDSASRRSAHQFDPERAGSAGPAPSSAPSADEGPEDLGEFRERERGR